MIVQVEYPKSGGTWVYKMLSYYLNIPNLPLLKSGDGGPVAGDEADPEMARREGCDGKNPFPGQKKFGFISQSHELPKNRYFSPEYCTYFLVRDGRDVIVSYYFYQSRYIAIGKKITSVSFLRSLVAYWGRSLGGRQPYTRTIDMRGKEKLFDSYVSIRATEWKCHVNSWKDQGKPFFRYEDLLKDTTTVFKEILAFLGAKIDADLVRETVSMMSFDNCRKLENGQAQNARFYRKGIKGDWKNHFTKKQKDIFKSVAGQTLIDLGYEKNLDW